MTPKQDNIEPAGFSKWLFELAGENTPIGDLAQDAIGDEQWPRNGTEFEEFWQHLSFRTSYEIKQTFIHAWELFSGDDMTDFLEAYD